MKESDDIEIPEIMKELEGDSSYHVRDKIFDKGWVKKKVLEKEDRKKRALNLIPFTRVVWRSEEKRREWEKKIQRASRVYHDAEWEMTAREKRKCGTIQVDQNNFDEMLERFTQDDLHFYPVAKSAKYEGFSHKHIPPEEGDEWYVYGALCGNSEDAMAFKRYERKEGDHESIGDLLGYPRCCQEKFIERWPQSIDPLFEAALETENTEIEDIKDGKQVLINSVSPFTNQMYRYFGVRITSHLPCSFDCERTKKIGKDWLSVMKDIDEEAAEYALEILNLPTTWDAYRGIVEVRNPLFIGITTTGFFKEKRVIKVNSSQ